jgi:hypothetical protein
VTPSALENHHEKHQHADHNVGLVGMDEYEGFSRRELPLDNRPDVIGHYQRALIGPPGSSVDKLRTSVEP